jgi:hypothetical protein
MPAPGVKHSFRVRDDTPGIALAVGNRPRSNGCLALSTGCAFIGGWAVPGRQINPELRPSSIVPFLEFKTVPRAIKRDLDVGKGD